MLNNGTIYGLASGNQTWLPRKSRYLAEEFPAETMTGW